MPSHWSAEAVYVITGNVSKLTAWLTGNWCCQYQPTNWRALIITKVGAAFLPDSKPPTPPMISEWPHPWLSQSRRSFGLLASPVWRYVDKERTSGYQIESGGANQSYSETDTPKHWSATQTVLILKVKMMCEKTYLPSFTVTPSIVDKSTDNPQAQVNNIKLNVCFFS